MRPLTLIHNPGGPRVEFHLQLTALLLRVASHCHCFGLNTERH